MSGACNARLLLSPDIAQAEHLGRRKLVDLVLDRAHYGARTTASDAPWADTRALTWRDATFPSCVAGSLVHPVGLPELVAEGEERYLNLVFARARRSSTFAPVRARSEGWLTQ